MNVTPTSSALEGATAPAAALLHLEKFPLGSLGRTALGVNHKEEPYLKWYRESFAKGGDIETSLDHLRRAASMLRGDSTPDNDPFAEMIEERIVTPVAGVVDGRAFAADGAIVVDRAKAYEEFVALDGASKAITDIVPFMVSQTPAPPTA